LQRRAEGSNARETLAFNITQREAGAPDFRTEDLKMRARLNDRAAPLNLSAAAPREL